MSTITFSDGFHGVMEMRGQKLDISESGLHPYDLTYGAIGSCLYSTFLDELEKRHLTVRRCVVDVDGTKRQSVPALVKELKILFTVESDADEKDLRQAFAMALAHCSMVQTFARVAEQIDADIKKAV